MKSILLVITLALALTACGNKNKSTESAENTTIASQEINIDENQTTVIYFHSNHRCATCMAVENITKEAVDTYKGKVPFHSVDITLEENKALMSHYKIGGQSLVVVNKDQKIDITNEAFMYARSSPEKVKSRVTTTIDSLP